MRILRQLEGLIDGLPPWGQVLLGMALLAYSGLSIYGRVNVSVGKKIFSKVPEDQIRTNWVHIIGYTVVPVIVTVGYSLLLYTKHFGG